jgi:SNF2 family DNA or RNA helicase
MPSFIYESMRDYQRTGAHFLRKAGSALLADEPGLGKTIQTLGSILATRAFVYPNEKGPFYHLVVCPKVAVRNVWEPEIRRWYKDQRFEILTLVGKVADRQKRLRAFEPLPDTEHVFVIVNIESLRIKPEEQSTRISRPDTINWSVKTKEGKRWMWYAPENGILPEIFSMIWDTVVVDESHRALIRTKQGSAPMSQTRAGLVLLPACRRVALSGTPMRGKPEQLWGTLDWLLQGSERHPGPYWTWVKEYFRLSSNGFSNYVIDADEPFRPDGEERLAKDLQRVMLRRTKGEVLPDLPPKTYAGAHLDPHDDRSPLGIWLEMSPVQRRLYDQLESEGMLIGKDRSEVPVEGTLALYTRQRQIATAEHEVVSGVLHVLEAGPKLDWLLDWLEENSGEQIVVVSQFTSVIDAFYDRLEAEGIIAARITGRVSDKARSAAIEGFQNGSIQVMFLNTKAGGVALTLDSADYLVFLDETSIPDDQIQAEDRLHRASRMHNVTIYYLRTLGTIEEEVAWVAAARQDVQQYLLDGARGVEAAKRIFYTTTRKEAS